MTYETIATFSQVTSLLMFIAMFLAVLVYALWPANKARFDAIQKRALGLDQQDGTRRGMK
ncbi:MAG: CcoQ/FixQ family Cbb3-type cytochrome c oxidase assembly chaperone [Hyphomicrobiales bacterium]|nr:CcoQ/FixQ family Cbb3-type cytochrome c oxidase assembly chaperone [Hyphomicrobiales bacterium]